MTRSANRLATEASPYLRQHGQNPVDWYPWGPEALSRARRENKPILLSIGYAACHWCHVMQHESFEDPAIAAEMNRSFVNVKVDREERPDLDHVYQLVVQLMGRGGGWPLTVFLTPEQRPFFAGTYFPPQDRHGMPGFPKVLAAIAEAYHDRRDDVEQQAQELTQAIGRVYGKAAEGGDAPSPELLARASKKLLARFDDQHGGFGKRPKFPNVMSLEVLLRRGLLEGDATARACVQLTLQHMRAGGLWDQLRGGFHRYSTDERWLVPHFEKMLYDNALLLRLYLDGYRAFGDEEHADTVRRLVAYLFAEMRADSGPFYASQDADSEGHEGTFFVWTEEELERALADEPAALAVAKLHFGVTREGNFEGSGRNVLSVARPVAAITVAVGRGPSEVRALIERAREKLRAARERRPRPQRDEKLLVAWNALLISALAEAGRALREPSWVEAAGRAFESLERTLVQGGEVRRYALPHGVPAGENKGFLDDHANLANAALDLYAATAEPRYVELAGAIATRIREAFADELAPGFYFTAKDGEALISRTKDGYDQAVPSGAAMAALLFVRLGELGGAPLAAPGEAYLRAAYSQAADDAFAFGQTVLVLDRLVRGTVDVVIVGGREDARTQALVDEVFAAYLPNKNVVVLDPARPETGLAAPALAEGKIAGDAPVAYVCRGRTCSAPVHGPDALRALLRAGSA